MGKGYYSLFQLEAGKAIRSNNLAGYLDLLQSSPKILLEKSYFDGLKVYGGLLSGSNSIIMNWVDFMQKQTNKKQPNSNEKETKANEPLAVYTRRSPLELLLQTASIERQTASIRNFWSQKMKNGHSVFCTWSGEPIKKIEDLAIDHAIPFSVLFNNDYWNLVPAKNNVNSKKSDKILSKQQLSNSKSRLISIWNEYQSSPELAPIFLSQCQISLTKEAEISLEKIFDKFFKINEGFVELRGMESWNA
jgi:CRISPR/Cas system Type II protein with McrA/HNH and RuvC-like nuclease domain